MQQYDEEVEQIVIGSLIQNPKVFPEVSEIVKGEDFSEKNRLLFEAIAELTDQNENYDELILASYLKEKGLLDKIGGRSYVAYVASQGSPISVKRSAERVKELSMRRHLFQVIRDVELNLKDPSRAIKDILDKAESALLEVSNWQKTQSVEHIRSASEDFAKYLKEAQQRKGIIGTPTKFPGLDNLTGGFRDGQLIILAARPAVGKTTFALNVAQNVAVMAGRPVLIFSLEMNKLELFMRMVAAMARFPAKRLQQAIIKEHEKAKIKYAVENLVKSPIYIDDSADLDTWDFKQRCRRLAAQLKAQNQKLGLIVVDYLQLMRDVNTRDGRQQEVAAISRTLKVIAKDLNVPVLALSQMNRSIEQRGKDPRPQLSDLRESGSIEQDADIVMFLHRPNTTAEDDDPNDEKNLPKLIVAKHRAGPTAEIKLVFEGDKNLFRERDDTHRDQ